MQLAVYVSNQVPLVVIGDPKRFRHIITNLVGNSLKVCYFSCCINFYSIDACHTNVQVLKTSVRYFDLAKHSCLHKRVFVIHFDLSIDIFSFSHQ